MKELTKGRPAKVILLFAIPIILGSILQQLYNLADSKIVSTYVGTDALAAVGATSVISDMIIAFLNGLTQGFAIPISESFGAKDYKKMRRYIAGMMSLTVLIAALTSGFILYFIRDILKGLQTPEEIMEDAITYIRIIIAGIILTALYNMLANILRAVGDSISPLICLIVSVLLNVGMDVLLVSTLGLGVKGAAYATLIAQGLSVAFCVVFILIRFKDILPKRDEWKINGKIYGYLFSSGMAMGLMACIVNIGTVILQRAINNLGTNIVTAHTAARRVFSMLTVSIYSIGVSITTYVGQNMGAKKYDRVRQGIKEAILASTVITTVLVAVCYLFSRFIFQWLANTSDADIIDPAVMYARISIVFFYVLGPVFILRFALQGMGRRIIPVCTSVVEMIIKIVSAFLIIPSLEYLGVAFTEPISWIAMLIPLTIAFVRTDWKKLETMEEPVI